MAPKKGVFRTVWEEGLGRLAAGAERLLQKTHLCFECFPYVCPEPVLVR
jgi:hypothetical protein